MVCSCKNRGHETIISVYLINFQSAEIQFLKTAKDTSVVSKHVSPARPIKNTQLSSIVLSNNYTYGEWNGDLAWWQL